MDEQRMSDQIKSLKAEISATPHHKGTEHYIGRLRAKIARLEDQLFSKRLKSGGGGGSGYAVGKSGDATVVLVGLPSVGKSTLLNQLTDAKSKTAHYPFTTLTVIPGMMSYRGAQIQMLDVPGLISGAAVGRGRGKEVLSVVRIADLILFLVDSENIDQAEVVIKELELAGIRVGRAAPEVVVNKKTKGGILIKNSRSLKGLTAETARGIIEELGVKNAEVLIKDNKINQERLIDAILGNRVYLPYLLIINKVDKLTKNQLSRAGKQFPRAVLVSALAGQGIDYLKQAIFDKLGLKRVYLKPSDGEADFNEPLIMRDKETVADVAIRIGQVLEGKRAAYVWGRSAKFPGQLVANNHILVDEDIVSFR
ncbi:MAG: 50S ribosome-binding GTPase [Candidatus Shapirobacteria bacterium]|nr:50S ribosome-binding GTPase [Candidatus Shapirobacteria bacterium]MDD5073782.1 50S ribosome-binding GTPase [Candidatus Shapirobacteria bacterium]MDD5481616.1 50S ribosome-binding GTPase [Candidatus Shapirobacteria bacterium]